MHEVERAVERVIQTFHENYGEQITVDDMARTAMYSKFHFTRIFQRVTGLTPGRFLSAVRLQKAKQLLTDTSLKVTDISHMVGYTSVGTFSSRFGYSVGLPPTTYRQTGGFRPWKSVDHHRPAVAKVAPATPQRSVIRGNIAFSASAQERPVFIGLFAERVPRGQPIRCTVVHRPGPFALEDVPDGTWYVMACAENKERDIAHANGHAVNGHGLNGHGLNGHGLNGHARNGNGRPVRANGYATLVSDLKLSRDQALLVGDNGPITIRNGMVRLADVRLRPMSVLDPPVVLALPDMRPEILAARAGSAA